MKEEGGSGQVEVQVSAGCQIVRCCRGRQRGNGSRDMQGVFYSRS